MPELSKLKLPEYQFRFRTFEQSKQIFDPIRKKFVNLTPEEWVRQNVVMYLTNDLSYPASCISIEHGLKLNALEKRTDIVVYDSRGKAWMLVECKAPSVKIDQNTLDQIGRYNIVHKAPYLFISNGLTHYMFSVSENSCDLITGAPDYGEPIKT